MRGRYLLSFLAAISLYNSAPAAAQTDCETITTNINTTEFAATQWTTQRSQIENQMCSVMAQFPSDFDGIEDDALKMLDEAFKQARELASDALKERIGEQLTNELSAAVRRDISQILETLEKELAGKTLSSIGKVRLQELLSARLNAGEAAAVLNKVPTSYLTKRIILTEISDGLLVAIEVYDLYKINAIALLPAQAIMSDAAQADAFVGIQLAKLTTTFGQLAQQAASQCGANLKSLQIEWNRAAGLTAGRGGCTVNAASGSSAFTTNADAASALIGSVENGVQQCVASGVLRSPVRGLAFLTAGAGVILGAAVGGTPQSMAAGGKLGYSAGATAERHMNEVTPILGTESHRICELLAKEEKEIDSALMSLVGEYGDQCGLRPEDLRASPEGVINAIARTCAQDHVVAPLPLQSAFDRMRGENVTTCREIGINFSKDKNPGAHPALFRTYNDVPPCALK